MDDEQALRIKVANLNQLQAVIRYECGISSILMDIPHSFFHDISIETIGFTHEDTEHLYNGDTNNRYSHVEICGENDLKLAASLGIKTELIAVIYPEVLKPNFTVPNTTSDEPNIEP